MKERGDTIIEVLLAVTVFSIVAVGGVSLMNPGTAIAQRSLEISQVRDQMDAQADALRYLHDTYVSNLGRDATVATVWRQVSHDHETSVATDFTSISDADRCLPLATNAFAIDVDKLNGDGTGVVIERNKINIEPVTFARVLSDGTAEGIWIEAVKGTTPSGVVGYHDFHIRACWSSPGQQTPVTLGTIVRLYDPAS